MQSRASMEYGVRKTWVPLPLFSQVAMGSDFGCILVEGNKIYCWWELTLLILYSIVLKLLFAMCTSLACATHASQPRVLTEPSCAASVHASAVPIAGAIATFLVREQQPSSYSFLF